MNKHRGLMQGATYVGLCAALAWAGHAFGQPPDAAGHDTSPAPPVIAAHPVTADVTVTDAQRLHADK
jgi:hypothetical protein